MANIAPFYPKAFCAECPRQVRQGHYIVVLLLLGMATAADAAEEIAEPSLILAGGYEPVGMRGNGKNLNCHGAGTCQSVRAVERLTLNRTTGTMTSRSLAPMHTARHAFAAGVIHGRFYVSGGERFYKIGGVAMIDYLSSSEVYDPLTDSWQYVCNMSTARVAAASGVLDNSLIVAGGVSPSEPCDYNQCPLRTVEKYDPATDEWTRLEDMKKKRTRAGGAVMNGRFYVVGGQTENDRGFHNERDVEAYEPLRPPNERWSVIAASPGLDNGLVDAAVFVLRAAWDEGQSTVPRLCVAGGSHSSVQRPTDSGFQWFDSTLQCYDAAKEEWFTEAPIGPPVKTPLSGDTAEAQRRNSAPCAVLGEDAYLLGGNNRFKTEASTWQSAEQRTVLSFSASTATWRDVPVSNEDHGVGEQGLLAHYHGRGAASAMLFGRCPGGWYLTDGGGCALCPAGKHRRGGALASSTACGGCPTGKYSGEPSKAHQHVNCTRCPDGYFAPVDFQRSCARCGSGSSGSDYIPCAKGEYDWCGTQVSRWASARICLECTPGNYLDPAAGCVACAAGRFAAAAAALSCKACPLGMHQPDAGRAFCKRDAVCGPGHHVRNESAAALGDPGARCRACPAGYFQDGYGHGYGGDGGGGGGAGGAAKEATGCGECPVGYFQPRPGESYCKAKVPCSPGTYDTSASASAGVGAGSSSSGSSSGGTSGSRRSAANSSSSDSERCRSCPPGSFSLGGTVAECGVCPLGKWQKDAGRFYCDEAKAGALLRPAAAGAGGADGKVVALEEYTCPPGMGCANGGRAYAGNVWHDPDDPFPVVLYTCVNDGCPPRGAASMSCREGYDATSPLCAVCSEGYYEQLRRCVGCGEPRVAPLVAAVLGVAAIVALVASLLWRFRKYLTPSLLALFKILVSFLTIVMTIDTQFGIQWPPAFLSALATLSILSFDLSAITSGFCLVRVSYYDELLFSTLALVLTVSAILLACRFRPKYKAGAIELACYISLFAYPLVSVKVVGLWGCHEVNGKAYLRSDYSLECYDAKWQSMAGYASFFLVIYVIGLPVFILRTLWLYSKKLQGRAYLQDSCTLSFLLEDYNLLLPAMLWESVEILRKLLLSVIGSFWSTKSAMAVATALLVSGAFLFLHALYEPFRERACNRVQSLLLQCLTLLYFAGLLIKVEAVEAADRSALDALLVAALALAVGAVTGAMALSVRTVVARVRTARHVGAALKRLPQRDPPHGSDAFYRIQIPVESSNMGEKFAPKLPALLSHIPDEQKLEVVHLLTAENEPIVEGFFHRLGSDWAIPLTRVKQSHEVDQNGKIAVKCSRKTDESILAKAIRPSILAENPHFSVEHVRDTFRFKGVVFSFRDALRFIYAMDQDRNLCPGGLSEECVAKLDVAKLREPKEWGWRFLAFDFVMPNHQIMECYVVFTEMEHTKKADDATAVVCPELSNHEIFEKWRVVDTAALGGARLDEFERDKAESNRRYDHAYRTVLSHTSAAEFAAFWGAFGADTEFVQEEGAGAVSPLSSHIENPMRESEWLDNGISTSDPSVATATRPDGVPQTKVI